MKNCRSLKIYKYDIDMKGRVRNESNRVRRWKRVQELVDFKNSFIDKFNSETQKELHKYDWRNPDSIPYKNARWRDINEVAFDMMHDDFGLQTEHQWTYFYIGVPLERTDIIEYLDENNPTWCKTVERI